ncbi:hypothetical protein [Rickettsia tamurae]|uniref:hypothetical protein n=1 Tax=Rickettsia tamurae TaxID=334545 RepID=UPI00050A2497|nr:hypothetical protein [Rickettsia tamurae]
MIYSIGNKTPLELYDDNGIVKQEFSQILKQAFALLMEPKVIKEPYDFEGIIYLVHSKVNELEQSGVKGLIDNKLQELQHIQEEVAHQELSLPLTPH